MKYIARYITLISIFIFAEVFLWGEAWELESAEYYSNEICIIAQDTDPKLMFWRPDGLKFFMIGDISDKVHQYNVEVAWDINTAEYENIFFDFSAQVTDPKGIFYKPDGMRMFLNDCATDNIYEYDLSTAWDITTLSYTGVSFFFRDQVTNPKSLYFKPDGTRCYIDCYNHDRIYQFDLAQPWELSTIAYNGESYYFHDLENEPQQVSFRQDGAIMYLNGSGSDSIFRFSLNTPWDVTTAVYEEISLDFTPYLGDHMTRGHHFSPDGHLLYIIGCQHRKISQLTLENAWCFDRVFFDYNFPTNQQDNDIQNLFFNSDGSRMYLQGYTFNKVFQYDLTTPYDLRSAEYNGIYFSFAAQESNPRGMYFKPDGSIMYLCGSISDKIWQYTLSTPWDLSSVINGNIYFDISFLEPNCRDLYLKPDGTKLFLAGANHRVCQLTLQSPWDITTAVYDNICHSVIGQTSNERGLFIKPDGTKLFLVASTENTIFQYSMSDPWNLETMLYDEVSLNLHNYDQGMRDLFFKPEGDILFFNGCGTVFQFSLEQDCPPLNFPPEFNLPDSICFDEDSSLVMDFEPYIFDVEDDPISLCVSGNQNIQVSIDSFIVSMSALPDWNGMEEISFSASDDSNRSTTIEDVFIVVNPINDPPLIMLPDSLIMSEDVTLTTDFCSWISDLDNDPLSLNVTGNSFIDVQINGLLVDMIPFENWSGCEELVFSVSDGIENSSDSILIEIIPVNDPPWIALPDSLVFYSDSQLLEDFSEYCGDIDNTELVLSACGNDSINLFINDLEVTFCTECGWTGSETVYFTVDDCQSRLTCCDSVLVMSCPSGKPVISSIIDRPDDQGGYVYLSFDKCYYDDLTFFREFLNRETEFYTVWYLADETWIALNSLGDLGEDSYTALVQTPADSISTNPALTSFRVSAHMDEGTWISLPQQGYSVDNLAPNCPTELMICDNSLHWAPSYASDLAYYSIYQDSLILAYTTNNTYDISGCNGNFWVTATDIHENESSPSEQVSGGFSYGDVDANGFVEAFDASLVLQYFCQLEPEGFPLPWESWRIETADVDGNDYLEAYDASLILRFSVGIINQFPVENIRH